MVLFFVKAFDIIILILLTDGKPMKNKPKYTSIGGSALIEGVMMRGHGKMSIAVRRANGDIALKIEDDKSPKGFYTKIPIVRGVIGFITSMVTSYKALMYSADVSMEDISEQEKENGGEGISKKLMNLLSIVAMVVGLLFGVLAFFYLPTLVADLFSKYVFELGGVTKRVAVGVFKMLIFACYLLAVSQMNDMKRVFMYHGAEHKTIFCHEAKGELTPAVAKTFKRFHPRCGTSFVIIVLIVSLFASLLIPWKTAALHTLLKLLFLPVVMGVAYECIKLAGRFDNVCTRIISAPGLWFQRITTKEPDEDQLEVAIWAMRGVLEDFEKDVRFNISKDGIMTKYEDK